MKALRFFSVMALFLSAMTISAQDNDQLRMENTSLFVSNVKAKNYADAVAPWTWVYENAPSSTLYIYAYGTRILNWQISQAKDDAEKQALVEKLMKLYDDRIQYFGSNAKTPTPAILGQKAMDYVKFYPEDNKTPYEWLEQSLNGMGEKSEVAYMQQYFALSDALYKADKAAHGEKYIQDFTNVVALLDKKIEQLEDDKKEQAMQVRLKMEADFGASGAASCEALDEIYGKDLEANKTNQGWLTGVLKFYKKAKCKESNVYAKASECAHRISPSFESAAGCANFALKNKEYNKAISFLEEAAKLTDDDNDKAEVFYNVAQIYYSLNNYTQAKAYCQKALASKANYGDPYILIATLYANFGKEMFGKDAILNSTIYWAVVDKLERAKAVDASVAGQANQMIAAYKKYYPKAEDVFMKPELEKGKPFSIGGWVNETVICR